MEINNIPENTLDLINQGCALMAQEQYEIALEKFKLAVEDSPKYSECYVNLGNVYVCLSDYDKAIDSFKKVLMLDKDSVEALFDLGNVYFLKNDIVSAIKYFSMAEEKGNLSADMNEIISGIYLVNGDTTQALRYLNKAINCEPLNGNYYLEKAQIYIDLQKPNEAIETLDEMNSILPDAYEPYDLLSQIYVILNDYDNAIGIVEKGIKKFPSDPNILHLKFKVLTKFGKYDEAKELVNLMKDNKLFDERLVDNTLILSEMLLKDGKNDDAIDCLEYCIKNSDEYSQEILFSICLIYLKTQNFEKCIKYSEIMMENKNDLFYEATAAFYHASAKEQMGNLEEAMIEYKKITKDFRKMTILNPSFYEGYMYRLLAHKVLKEYDEALKLADYMENLFPDRVDGLVFKYVIYLDMGKEDLAEEYKKKALEINPDFTF